jgi:uncharacterized phiE125 gp8 family phage protein
MARNLAVSLAEAKKHLRIDDDPGLSLDSIVTAWLAGIIAHAEHVTGRSFVNQPWKARLGSFPCAIPLPKLPVVTVDAVRYVDANGVTQTLAPSAYVLDTLAFLPEVRPVSGTSWPATATDRKTAVLVDYTSGYGPDDTTTPDGIKLYILAKLVEQFDPDEPPPADGIAESFIDGLLAPYKVEVYA